ncbi:BMC domain-containing protein [Bacillus dakarensis]|uniref:BMC domain-containing protein n=1 Tax=Robertmurraya dakarensis TaxID=1926278 RepID=UPI0009823C8D|nr:BMC domain-containing protein [Bacillus dakarensis]
MSKAVGLLEVQGYSVALAAMDKACKAAEITIEGIEVNNPAQGDMALIPVVVQVKFTGGVSDVEIALETAAQEASRYIDENDILTRLIPSVMEELQPLLSIGKVKRK